MRKKDFSTLKSQRMVETWELQCPFCEEGLVECFDCQGEGYIYYDESICPTCDGSGAGHDSDTPCETCKGKGVVPHAWKSECDCCHGLGKVPCSACEGVPNPDIAEMNAYYVGRVSEIPFWYGERAVAWEHGFSLFAEGGDSLDVYMFKHGTGYDATWLATYVKYKITGRVLNEDREECLSSGGYVFLSRDDREELLEAMLQQLKSPQQYWQEWTATVGKIDQLMKERP